MKELLKKFDAKTNVSLEAVVTLKQKQLLKALSIG